MESTRSKSTATPSHQGLSVTALKIAQDRNASQSDARRLKKENCQLGFDHERLTFRFQGRDYRLTDVEGEVIQGIVS